MLADITEIDSDYFYRLFCTGRKHIKWAFVDVQTKRRQDLTTNLFYQIVMPEVDRSSLEIKVANKDAKAVAYVLKSKNVKRALEDYKDFKQMTRKFAVFKNTFLSLHAENDEVLKGIFTPDVLLTLGK